MNFHGGNIYGYKEEIIDFSSNINPLGVPESFKQMLKDSLDDFTKYPDIEYTALKIDIADYIGIKDSSCVIPGNGAVELIYKAIGKSGKKKVIGLAPAFSEYNRAASFYGMDFISISAFDEEFQQVDIDYVADMADENSVVVICNPNNPTGTLVTKSQMISLAGRLQEKGSRLIIDEAFMEFAPDYPINSMVSELQNYYNVLVVKAVTKFFGMPGIRLGYAVCQDLMWLNSIREGFEPWNINTAAVLAGKSVFRDYDYIKRSREWIEEERNFLFAGFSTIDKIKVYKSSANFHLIKLLDENMDAWKLKEHMLKHRILIRTPEGFEGLNGQYARLAVKDRERNKMLIKYLQSLS